MSNGVWNGETDNGFGRFYREHCDFESSLSCKGFGFSPPGFMRAQNIHPVILACLDILRKGRLLSRDAAMYESTSSLLMMEATGVLRRRLL